MTTVACLYVDARGPYIDLCKADRDGLEAYDGRSVWSDGHEHRYLGNPSFDVNLGDARLYDGPFPVVAHPPCTHYGRVRHLGKADDSDCAPRAVEQVRKFGGVLEHPAQSKLWALCGLPKPGEAHDAFGGYTVEVDQVLWGHACRKRTWLYLVGVPREALEAPPYPGAQTNSLVQRWPHEELTQRLSHTARHQGGQQADQNPHAARVRRVADSVCARCRRGTEGRLKLRPDPNSPETFTAARTCAGCERRVIVEAGDLKIIRTAKPSAGRVQAKCFCGEPIDVGSTEELPAAVVKLAEVRK